MRMTDTLDKYAGQIRKYLSSQGFTGELNGKVEITKLGNIAVGSTRYKIFYYAWEESNPSGAAVHASYRVILIRGSNRYIGSYSVEGRPKKLGLSSIQFDYPEAVGNKIIFDKNGPPAKVLLNGELQVLAK
jgi:hypothetical protein